MPRVRYIFFSLCFTDFFDLTEKFAWSVNIVYKNNKKTKQTKLNAPRL